MADVDKFMTVRSRQMTAEGLDKGLDKGLAREHVRRGLCGVEWRVETDRDGRQSQPGKLAWGRAGSQPRR